MASLIHLIYASAAVGGPSEAELAELLRNARRNNRQVGVTGMLLYIKNSFFQVLEGDAAAVDAAFATIAADARHTRVVMIIRERISRRSFGEWSMGYATATPQEVVVVTGRNDFFAQGFCVDRLGSGRAKKLLSAFRDGRRRSHLDGPPTTVGAAQSQMVNV